MAARLTKQDIPITPSLPLLKLREFRALEKVFSAEIEHTGLPYQSSARVYRQLADLQYIKETTVLVGPRLY